jgi:branched-chain amino acid transport system substrate-binding protein
MRTASTTRTGTRGLVAIAAISALGLAACSGGGGGPQTGGASKLTNDKDRHRLLNDQSGVYKDLSGPNSKVAIEMAIDDYKAKYGDQAVAKTVEVIQADHRNKADVANTRRRDVRPAERDLILDVPNSAAALAVATQAKAKKKLTSTSAPGRPRSPAPPGNKYTFHWAYARLPSSRRATAARSSAKAARRGTSSTPTTPSART